MPRGSIRGVVGLIRWAYYTAAAVNGYTVTQTTQGWRLQATVVNADAFKMAQRPLLFVAPHQRGEWRWPILSLERRPDGTVSAQLGPQESVSHVQSHPQT